MRRNGETGDSRTDAGDALLSVEGCGTAIGTDDRMPFAKQGVGDGTRHDWKTKVEVRILDFGSGLFGAKRSAALRDKGDSIVKYAV